MPFTFSRHIRGFALVCAVCALGTSQPLQAQQAAAPASPTAAITMLLTRQAADWNRGDLDAFASGYKNSPDILFIGRNVEHGYAGMLAGYKAHYPTRDAMGVLSFEELAVQSLDERFATATGHYHLERSVKGGGPADGYFLLVLEQTQNGWKIVRDDTTGLPSARH
ncbi:MAG: YybH family protein [Janthinobacterium lividum]